MKTRIESLLPPDGSDWSPGEWSEVALFLTDACSRDELIGIADTVGIAIPLGTAGRELPKDYVLAMMRDLAPADLARQYRALLAKRRSDGPKRFPTAA